MSDRAITAPSPWSGGERADFFDVAKFSCVRACVLIDEGWVLIEHGRGYCARLAKTECNELAFSSF